MSVGLTCITRRGVNKANRSEVKKKLNVKYIILLYSVYKNNCLISYSRKALDRDYRAMTVCPFYRYFLLCNGAYEGYCLGGVFCC